MFSVVCYVKLSIINYAPIPLRLVKVVMLTFENENEGLRTVHSMIRFTATGNSTERQTREGLSLTDSENRT